MLNTLRFHHIGYAVNNIEITAKYYKEAGWNLSDIQIDKTQNARIAFLSKPDMPLIELIAAIDETSPIVKILEKAGVSTYHVCYETDDIQSAVGELRKQKYISLFNPVEAIALSNRKICYLYNKNVGLIELVEAL